MHIQPIQPQPNHPIHTTGPLTIAAALAHIANWSDLSQSTRAGLASALSVVRQMSGLPADSMPLTPASLRQRVLNRPAAAWGIKTTSKRNILSRLRLVLRRLDIIDPAGGPLTDAWQTLLQRLDARHRAGIIGLARFCSARGIEPEDVGAETMIAFLAYLEARTLTPLPRKRVGDLRKSLNAARERIDGWSVNKIPRLANPDQYILPPEAFPASFLQDLRRFGDRLRGEPLKDDAPNSLTMARPKMTRGRVSRGRLKPLRKGLRDSTVALREDHARWAASALVATGVLVEDITSLASLFTPLERAHAILRFLYLRAGEKPSAGGMHVAEVLLMIAKYYLRLPEHLVDLIREWGQGVTLSYHGITDKNENAVQAVMTPACEQRLIELPEAFMTAAQQRLETNPAQAVELALRALAIEILTTYPFRLANLLGLRFDLHLYRADPRGPVTGILVSPDETKNDNRIELPISARLAWFIEEWTTRFRGLIAAPGCLYLFPGYRTGNRSMTPQGMRDAIKSATGEFVGAVLSPHQFRHLAAKRFLAAFPGQYEALSQLLGHKDPTSARRSYAPRDKKEAARRFDAMNAERRETLRRTAPLPMSRPPKRMPRQGGR